MKFISQVEDIKLVMWEKTMMADSDTIVDADGKKKFVKNGKQTEYTTYFFRDGFGEKLVILTKENGYRHLEGGQVDISIDVQFNDFTKKNRVTLLECSKSKSK